MSQWAEPVTTETKQLLEDGREITVKVTTVDLLESEPFCSPGKAPQVIRQETQSIEIIGDITEEEAETLLAPLIKSRQEMTRLQKI